MRRVATAMRIRSREMRAVNEATLRDLEAMRARIAKDWQVLCRLLICRVS
jgi:hypothetical protein